MTSKEKAPLSAEQFYKAYGLALGDPMEIPSVYMPVVQKQFRAAMTRLLTSSFGKRVPNGSSIILKGAFHTLARSVLEYVCGATPLTQLTLLENVEAQTANLFHQRENGAKSAPGNRKTDKELAHKIISKAHALGMRYAATPRR